ncbi:MAG: tyrosine-type recombinase/integrase [Burkholderiaceae bacterium]|nr:tyrosine-type recombinase/integrase [Burkholderiaceae bacterium]
MYRYLTLDRDEAEAEAQRRANDRQACEWLTWLTNQKGRTPETATNYARVLARFLDDVVCARPLAVVSVPEVEEWVMRDRRKRGARDGGPGSPATRARDLTVIKAFYGWLSARGHVHRDLGALLVAPKISNRQPKPVPDDVWCEVYPQLAPTAQVTMGLMFFAGLRRAEVAALQGEHFDSGMLRNFPRKGGGDDTLPYADMLGIIGDHLPHLLCGHTSLQTQKQWRARAVQGGSIFNMRPDDLNAAFARWLAPTGHSFTPHQLRHSCATNMIRAGLPLDLVSWLLNHASIATTMRYVKVSGTRLSEWRNR